jgi:hypothetical protein
MGFNPAWWLGAALAFGLAYIGIPDVFWKIVCFWGAVASVMVFFLHLLCHWMGYELQAPIKRIEEPMAVRTRDFPDGSREIRVRVTAHGFIFSQLNSEEMKGCLIKGEIRIESKTEPRANPKE